MTHPLASVTIATLLASKPQAHNPVITFHHDQTVSAALKVLSQHHILSAPLVMTANLEDLESGMDREETIRDTLLGWIDIHDLLVALLDHMKKDGQQLPTQMLALMSALDKAQHTFMSRPLITLKSGEDKSLVYETEVDSSLLTTIQDSFLGRNGHAVHRLAVFDPHGEITAVCSQMDVIKLLARQPLLLGGKANKTLLELGLVQPGAGHSIVVVDAHLPTLQAFDQMLKVGVSGAAVVSPTGQLVANLSASDLRGIQPEHLSVLALPVAELLALRHGTTYLGYSQRDSKEAEHDFFASRRRPPADTGELSSSPHVAASAADSEVRLITATRTTTLKEITMMMAENHVHRVYITDEAMRPEAVITPTDILRQCVTP
mmetsp:Transcript_12886/g.22736  ORF Transcript_12886/g.22736 Transcript_12886/m.22736 type:complete len:376 (+) Transcript_12886:56-1183(+)|eukprot:CAMPEP_0119116756 /NCGR_PEP_ID=MMETSP1180-20130426/52459_1 /TAXON_ID=3052 ORGANISM="Chlamydomonas cf sp, Strain CCMP681" /NCGR_SAMPLE_ID=MMETSP1180 /ASSEMBLY_ACC=CAM_ASM_000741 /LENGTH=375 /DNA_ID=CAMNT_0007105941 /DNA_START=33 /DNA_END=1160 /DNA_ORIENTATION=-